MGQSTDGILAYGFDLGIEEEKPEWLGEHDDLEDLTAADAGLTEPATENYKDPAWSAYWAAKRATEAACPIELVSHCSGKYPMYIMAVRGSVKTAKRGYPETLTADDLTVPPEKVAAAKAWCEAHGIEWQEAKWILASMWN